MSRWTATVIVESAVLSLLVGLYVAAPPSTFARLPESPAPGAAREATQANRPGRVSGNAADRPPELEREAPTAIPTTAFRDASAESAPYDAADPAGIVVFGTVTGDRPVPDAGGFWLTNDAKEQIPVTWDASQTYAAAGLRPGTWSLRVRIPGVFDHQETLIVAEAPNPLRHDIRMAAILAIRVLVVTPEGRPLLEELAKLEVWVNEDLLALATTGPLDPAATSGEPRRLARAEAGKFHWRHNLRPAEPPLPPACIGVVQPAAPGAFHLSLVYHGRILATRRAEAGAGEVSFTVAAADITSEFGSVRLKPVRAEDGRPLEEFFLAIDKTGYMTERLPRGEDVSLTVGKLPAGSHQLRLGAEDREHHERSFETRAGETTDLRTIRLHSPASIRVQVSDASGKAIPASVEVHLLDAGGPGNLRHWDELRTDAHGVRTLGNLPPGRYLVTAWADSGFARGETAIAAGAAADVSLPLAAAAEVTVAPARDNIMEVSVLLTDGSGAPVLHRNAYRLKPFAVRLTPGGYRIELGGAGRPVRTYPFAVAEEPVQVVIGP